MKHYQYILPWLCLTALLLASCATVTHSLGSKNELQGVETITYADKNWSDRTPDRALDKQSVISFFFNGDGPKPWRFSYWHLAYVYGVKGTNVTIETRRSLYGDVSSEDVLTIWNGLRGLGIAMPSWRDGPQTETGKKWEWFFYP